MPAHKDLPEGIQIAIEILQNVPEEMLIAFLDRVVLLPEIDPQTHWNQIVEEWYNK